MKIHIMKETEKSDWNRLIFAKCIFNWIGWFIGFSNWIVENKSDHRNFVKLKEKYKVFFCIEFLSRLLYKKNYVSQNFGGRSYANRFNSPIICSFKSNWQESTLNWIMVSVAKIKWVRCYASPHDTDRKDLQLYSNFVITIELVKRN